MVDRSFLWAQPKALDLSLVPIEQNNTRTLSESCVNMQLINSVDEQRRERERWAKILGAKK